MQISNKKKSKFRLIVIALVLLVIGLGAAFYLFNKVRLDSSNDHLTSTQKAGGGSISSPKVKSDESTPTPSSDATPMKPSGTFVSNHHPNLSGTPAPNTMTSTCTTTPGALCTIQFTKNNTVKSLPSKAADANGNVNWDWKLQDIGLTEGTWKVVAIVSIGTNTTKESDALDLVVQQ